MIGLWALLTVSFACADFRAFDVEAEAKEEAKRLSGHIEAAVKSTIERRRERDALSNRVTSLEGEKERLLMMIELFAGGRPPVSGAGYSGPIPTAEPANMVAERERLDDLEEAVFGYEGRGPNGDIEDDEGEDRIPGILDRLKDIDASLTGSAKNIEAIWGRLDKNVLSRLAKLEEILPVWAQFKPDQVAQTLAKMKETIEIIGNLRKAQQGTDKQVGEIYQMVDKQLRNLTHSLTKRVVDVESAVRNVGLVAPPAPLPPPFLPGPRPDPTKADIEAEARRVSGLPPIVLDPPHEKGPTS